jgi:hypothetical protein
VLQLFNTIRKPTGFLLYEDNVDKLQYHKWVPYGPGTVYRTFTPGPTGTNGDNLSEYWNLRVTTSSANVYNRVHLVGVDSFSDAFNILISRREDKRSINALAGQEPANYVGFPTDFVWLDSRFANGAFVANAADRLLEILRLPLIEATFTCWLQPDLFPMDVVYVINDRSGISAIPLYVMSINNVWAYVGNGRQQMVSHIRARYLI